MTVKLEQTNKNPNKRMTKQRKVIKDILYHSQEHPTAEAIYEEARKVLPDISLGTVYRNLQVLLEEHAIVELSYGKKFSRFDGNVLPHYHFVCKECGRVFDIDMPLCHELVEQAAAHVPGKLDDHRLEFYGICQDCLVKSNRIAN